VTVKCRARARRTAAVLIAEIGVDMSALPTAKHLASWTRRVSRQRPVRRQRRSGHPRKGSKWLTATRTKAALAATTTRTPTSLPNTSAYAAALVGTDQGYCVRVVAGKSYECNWTTSLAGGQITVEGPFLDAGDSTLAITGGTGRYRKARGFMKLHSLENGTKFAVEFHVGG
jgi:Dirigent-like protein/Transposase IS116/IS110/IS902 family